MDFYDLDSRRHTRRTAEPNDTQNSSRPFLGIHFECCGTYARIYRDATERFYCGDCPRCGKQVRVPIGEGGTSSRFFSVQ